MRNSGIKTYFERLNAVNVDPGAIAAYERSIAKVVPEITRKLRESEQHAADLLVTSSAAARAWGSPISKTKPRR